MPWSYANIDWNGTGAMVQAVGSVAAILVAVWVDRGSLRRQQIAAAKAASEEQSSQLRAVRACYQAAQRMAQRGALRDVETALMWFTPSTRDMIKRRGEVLERVINGGHPPADILEALLIALYHYRRLVAASEAFEASRTRRSQSDFLETAVQTMNALAHADDRLSGIANPQVYDRAVEVDEVGARLRPSD